MHYQKEERRNQQGAKLYPFSGSKHGHDIEFRANRLFSEISDFENGEAPAGFDIKKAEDLRERLNGLRSKMREGTVWLTGQELQLAKETAFWAENQRQR